METNKVYNEKVEDFIKTIKSNSIKLIIADVPYFNIVNDEWDNQWETLEEWIDWNTTWLTECKRVLTDDGSLYYYGNTNHISYIKIKLDKILKYKNWITWCKKRGRGNANDWLYVREEILFYTKSDKYTFHKLYSDKCGTSNASKQKFKATGVGKRLTNVWDDILEMGWNNTGKCKMSAEKPVKLGERIILSSTNEGDLVYIPFAGSGSEIEACIKNNRPWIATETNETYINDLIMPRIS